MPHIHQGAGEHDQTVSAFIARVDGEEPRLLLHRHKVLGVYMQVGGHVELDETPWQALLSEINEESGYEARQLSVLQPKERLSGLSNAVLHPIPMNYNTHAFKGGDDHYHSDLAYGLVVREDPAGKVAEGESVDLCWFTLAELESAPEPIIYDNVREIGRFMLEVCLPAWEEVETAEFQ